MGDEEGEGGEAQLDANADEKEEYAVPGGVGVGGDAVLVGVDEFVGDLSEGDKGEDGRGGADHFKDKCYGGMCRHGAEQPRE